FTRISPVSPRFLGLLDGFWGGLTATKGYLKQSKGFYQKRPDSRFSRVFCGFFAVFRILKMGIFGGPF
ncbi:MAG: hypothetical protein LBF95_06665, partial [Treponema sp.]|nr:hypothetical protein [Treponema sp.]